MRSRDHRQRSTDEAAQANRASALTLAATVLLTVCLCAMSFLQLEQLGPDVGAIVVFRPGVPSADLWHVSASSGTATCILSPGAMADGGGSLIVEARRMSSPPIYRVHWAGRRTSNGSGDCGHDVDLVLSRTDLQKLANTAGGYGVGPKTLGP
jgi:hypothetical protein